MALPGVSSVGMVPGVPSVGMVDDAAPGTTSRTSAGRTAFFELLESSYKLLYVLKCREGREREREREREETGREQ